jgi:hypothetical protein
LVTKVSDFPMPTSWFSSNVKEYATYVQIASPPPGMRPGMTAEVAIRVEQLPSALQVPVQAIVERAGKHFVLVENGRSLKSREVAIGSTNDKFVIIKDGLKDGEQVAVNPRSFLDSVELPAEATQGQKTMLAGAPKANEPGAVKKTSLAGGAPAGALAGGPGRDGGPGRRAGGPAGADGAGPGGAAGPGGGGAGAGGPGGGRRRGGAGGGQMNPAAMWARMIAENDKNKDGKISLDEAPDRMKDNFAQNDANNDGFVDSAEFTAAMQKVMARFQQNGGAPGGGGPSL